MFRNYFKTSWRYLWRNKFFSSIKIAGLSIGFAVCMLIFLYSKDEISYDLFHKEHANIYRIVQTFQFGKDAPQKMGVTPTPLGRALKSEIPEIQQFVRVTGFPSTVKRNTEFFTETPLFVDSNFLSVFTFPLKEGDPATALKDISSVVITKMAAKKYFGTTTGVIGKIMQVKLGNLFDNFTVTGLADNVPQNSTVKFEMLLPFAYYDKQFKNEEWIGGNLNTFLLLSPKSAIPSVEQKMQRLFDKNTQEKIAKIKQQQNKVVTVTLGLQPLSNIHLNTKLAAFSGLEQTSNPIYSYILSSIAVFILIIACINFINLAIGQSLKRNKEIGIRKVIGGSRKQLIYQFLTESFIVSLIAFILAILLTLVLLPFFNELANKKLSLSYLSDGFLYFGFFLMLMLTSFIAGFYPSLVLSSFHPVEILQSRQKRMGRNLFTKGLIVLQFALAIFLIIATIAINKQVNYLFHQDLGYDASNLVKINLPYSPESDKLPAIFKNELTGQQSVVSVAARNAGISIVGIKVGDKQIMIDYNKVDYNYFPAFKIPVIAGRNFSPEFPSDSLYSVIINESFVREAEWTNENAIGKTFSSFTGQHNVTVVGVIKNYHFTTLKEKITPQLFSMEKVFGYGEVWVKIKPTNTAQTLSMLEGTFKKLVPFSPYDYQFMDDINARNYEREVKWKKILSISSFIFLFISCIGLLGIVMLSIEQRTKEIGIRKVVGAGVPKLILLILKEFIILIVVAFVIIVPVGYYAVYKWLQDFAYHMEIGVWMFVLAGSLALIIALLTVGFQTVRAALVNPAKSLRTE